MNNLRVVHTIASLNADYGGPSRTVTQLTDSQACLSDMSVSIITQRCSSENTVPLINTKVAVYYTECVNPVVLRLGFKMLSALHSHFLKLQPEILHDHGLWMPTNHWVAHKARITNTPLIIQPRGMLEPWALNHKAWKKKLSMALFQRRDLESASVFIATSAMECESIRAIGLRQPVAVIPNGVLFGASCATDTKAAIARTGDTERVALFLSRLHPKKGILNLLRAWAQLAPKGWRLKIAGPDEGGHLAEVMTLSHKLGIAHAVEFVGSVDGHAKVQTYLEADLFVLPTFSENFGVVIAEALTHGLPVITTRGAPWADLETFGCGWWVDIGVDPLVHALREAIALSDDERRAMGIRGQHYVRRYDWDDIAHQTANVYRWILGRGPQPSCVQND